MSGLANLIINSNPGASAAAAALRSTQASLNTTMESLQTGKKINGPGQDAGGLGVSMQEQAEISRTEAVNDNVSNAIAFIQTQDGILGKVYEQLNRASTLVTKYSDDTKSDDDKTSYDTEFKEIVKEIKSVLTEKFNGVSLFAKSDNQNIEVFTTQDATQKMSLAKANLEATAIKTITGVTGLSAATIGGATGVKNITAAITKVAGLRAEASAKASRLFMVQDRLTVTKNNLESALSLIVDTDVATASTQMAKEQILMQSGATMLGQANSSGNYALQLLR